MSVSVGKIPPVLEEEVVVVEACGLIRQSRPILKHHLSRLFHAAEAEVVGVGIPPMALRVSP